MSESTTTGAPPQQGADTTTTRTGVGLGAVAERYALLGLLIAVVLFFALHPTTSPFFLTGINIQNVLSNLAVTGILAVGMVVPLVAGYFDLSVSAVAAASNVLVASLLCTVGAPIWVGLLAGVVLGPVIGAAVGYLAAVLRLNALIATLAVYTLMGGALLAYTRGATISANFPQSLGEWGAGQWFGLPRPFWLFVVVVLAGWYLLELTPFGRRLAAIGSSEPAARLAGINLRRLVLLAFVISGFLGALAGTLMTVRAGSGDATTGTSYLFPALTAVFLGQTAIKPGRVNIWGTAIAVLLAAVIVNGLSLFGAQSWVEQAFNGGALLASLVVATLGVRARDRRASKAILAAFGSSVSTGKPRKAAQLEDATRS
jgi:ribose transport system permease protein